jgi:hypothetical protein
VVKLLRQEFQVTTITGYQQDHPCSIHHFFPYV